MKFTPPPPATSSGKFYGLLLSCFYLLLLSGCETENVEAEQAVLSQFELQELLTANIYYNNYVQSRIAKVSKYKALSVSERDIINSFIDAYSDPEQYHREAPLADKALFSKLASKRLLSPYDNYLSELLNSINHLSYKNSDLVELLTLSSTSLEEGLGKQGGPAPPRLIADVCWAIGQQIGMEWYMSSINSGHNHEQAKAISEFAAMVAEDGCRRGQN